MRTIGNGGDIEEGSGGVESIVDGEVGREENGVH